MLIMLSQYCWISHARQMLTIKDLTQTVGGGVTPRMVRHYHTIGLLPEPARSPSNYRLYSEADVQRLRYIMALKQQGFQLSHIRQLLGDRSDSDSGLPLNEQALNEQLQQQYQTILQQLIKLRQTATALEGFIGRDRACQAAHPPTRSQNSPLNPEPETIQSLSDRLWQPLDTAVYEHPENFQEALQHLLPDLPQRPEIEIDTISHLVLACGDVSLAAFVHFSPDAIKAAREALAAGCTIVGDVPTVTAALDHPRLAHLHCAWTTLLDNPHIDSADDAEQAFWQTSHWQQRLKTLVNGNIWVIGYSPSVLMALCEHIQHQGDRPALVIGLPIGFSHAPASKRQLRQLEVPCLTTANAAGGGLLAAVALNRLAASLIEKPDCHCYLG